MIFPWPWLAAPASRYRQYDAAPPAGPRRRQNGQTKTPKTRSAHCLQSVAAFRVTSNDSSPAQTQVPRAAGVVCFQACSAAVCAQRNCAQAFVEAETLEVLDVCLGVASWLVHCSLNQLSLFEQTRRTRRKLGRRQRPMPGGAMLCTRKLWKRCTNGKVL